MELVVLLDHLGFVSAVSVSSEVIDLELTGQDSSRFVIKNQRLIAHFVAAENIPGLFESNRGVGILAHSQRAVVALNLNPPIPVRYIEIPGK